MTDPYIKELMEQAVRGEAKAQYLLGLEFEKGDIVLKDTNKSIKLILLAAKQNYIQAQNYLATLYENGDGEGVEPDQEKAFFWYHKAAIQDNALAQYNVGICYIQGQGVEKDEIKAFEWIHKAAERGDVFAQNTLGILYAEGKGTSTDYLMAYVWWGIAAKNGNRHSQANRFKVESKLGHRQLGEAEEIENKLFQKIQMHKV